MHVFFFLGILFEHGRISYDYLPNKMTETQYGHLGDIALVLKLVEEKVRVLFVYLNLIPFIKKSYFS